MYVATKMTGRQPALISPAPDDYVRSVLKKVGVTSRCFGYWPHELLASKRFHVFPLEFFRVIYQQNILRTVAACACTEYFSGKHCRVYPACVYLHGSTQSLKQAYSGRWIPFCK